MKGIILAGGMGSRLHPLTNIINKFLLPIYNKPLIEYSIETLRKADITDVAIVLGKKSAGQTIEYLKSGRQYGMHFTYFFQDEPLGVAHALGYAESFVRDDHCVVLCADNIIFDDIGRFINDFDGGCFITCKTFDDIDELKKFAVVYTDQNGRALYLEEKPQNPTSNLAFCGIQIYDSKVWDIVRALKPSRRGEYEITHVINEYIKMGEFRYDLLRDDWIDVGTPESLLRAQTLIFKRSIQDNDKGY